MRSFAGLLALAWMQATAVIAAPTQSLPESIFAKIHYAEETDAELRERIKQSAAITYVAPEKARPITVEALDLAAHGRPIAVYDHAYGLYLLLKNCYDGPGSSTFGPGTREDYFRVARRLLEVLDESGKVGQWVFTPEGQFYLDAYVTAAGGLGWYLYEDAKDDTKLLEKALTLARKATGQVQNPSQYWVHDSEVRILLALGREDEAWKIVSRVLEELPDFVDFQDLEDDARYRAWSAEQ